MTLNLLTEIQRKMPMFSKGQRNIATYILNHYEKAAYMTASKLGIAANVSESTVVRFAFELGYNGYPQLQTELQEMIKNKLTSVQRIEVATEQIGEDEVLDKVLNIDIEKIKKTLSEISRENFSAAVDAIVNSKSVYILGSGSASILARFMALYFNIMFDGVRLINATSSNETFEQIMRIGKDDIMIGISFPRYSKRSAKAMEFASNMGAKVIAITDSKSSPIAKNADVILLAKSDMASFVDSLVAPLSLINALIVAIGLKKHEEIKMTLDKLERIWDEYEVYQKAEEN